MKGRGAADVAQNVLSETQSRVQNFQTMTAFSEIAVKH